MWRGVQLPRFGSFTRLDELGALMERHAEVPEDAAFDLREHAVLMNKPARVDHDRESLHRDGALAAVDADARDAGNPCSCVRA